MRKDLLIIHRFVQGKLDYTRFPLTAIDPSLLTAKTHELSTQPQ